MASSFPAFIVTIVSTACNDIKQHGPDTTTACQVKSAVACWPVCRGPLVATAIKLTRPVSRHLKGRYANNACSVAALTWFQPLTVTVMLCQALAPLQALAQQALTRLSESSKGAAYQSWLGFYKSSLKWIGWSAEHLVQQANFFSETIGEGFGQSNLLLDQLYEVTTCLCAE